MAELLLLVVLTQQDANNKNKRYKLREGSDTSWIMMIYELKYS
jgi:hypothetical protein